jgi:hypothetical protein
MYTSANVHTCIYMVFTWYVHTAVQTCMYMVQTCMPCHGAAVCSTQGSWCPKCGHSSDSGATRLGCHGHQNQSVLWSLAQAARSGGSGRAGGLGHEPAAPAERGSGEGSPHISEWKWAALAGDLYRNPCMNHDSSGSAKLENVRTRMKGELVPPASQPVPNLKAR